MPGTDYKYVTRFTAKAHLYTPSDVEANEARASLDTLKEMLPEGIDPDIDIDLLYLVGDLAVAGVINLNDDGVSIEDMIATCRQYERRQVNTEHDRSQVVGYIVRSALSELVTNRLITPQEAAALGKPFNLAILAALWKVVNKDLCNFIIESSAPGSPDADALSLSFEVGFSDYDIVAIPMDDNRISSAVLTIHSDNPKFDDYDKKLRVNKGSGILKMGRDAKPLRLGRVLKGSLVPLGAGIVTVPAAAVKGIAPILDKPDVTWTDAASAGNGYQYSSTQLNLEGDDADMVQQYANSIQEDDLYHGEAGADSYGPSYGRETEGHLTALYGIKNSDRAPVEAVCNQFDPITVTLGEVSAFENEDKPYDVLKLSVDSTQLVALHDALKAATDNDSQWPTYTPHATIAYVKKGMASKYVGNKQFSGHQITFTHLTHSPSEGDKTKIPFTKSVYSNATMATHRVKLPQAFAEQAKNLRYPKVSVTLSDGRVLKDVTVFDGESLELDKALSMDGVVITNMTPQEEPQIDDSPTIHPHIDQQFPTKDPVKQIEDHVSQIKKHIAQNLPYTDAMMKHLEAAATILHIIETQSGVSDKNQSLASTTDNMKLTDLQALEAKVKTATKIEDVTEAFANISLFAQEIAKASEKYVKDAEDAKKAKDDMDKTCKAMADDLAEAKKIVKDMKDAQDVATASAAFQERMTAVNAHFNLDDETRACIVDEIKACSDAASFEKWFSKAKKLMKGFAKAGSQDVNSQDTTQTPDENVKKGTKDNVTSTDTTVTSPDKTAKADKADGDDDADDMKTAKAALDSAKANPTDKLDVDQIGNVGTASLMDQMMKAFAGGISIGGVPVNKIIADSKKK